MEAFQVMAIIITSNEKIGTIMLLKEREKWSQGM
jgi:hypothetical protein